MANLVILADFTKKPGQIFFDFFQCGAAFGKIGAAFPDFPPERLRMIHAPEVAKLVDEDIVRDPRRHKEQKRVQGDRAAPRGTAAPAAFLNPHAELPGGKSERAGKFSEAREQEFFGIEAEHGADRGGDRVRLKHIAADADEARFRLALRRGPPHGQEFVFHAENASEPFERQNAREQDILLRLGGGMLPHAPEHSQNPPGLPDGERTGVGFGQARREDDLDHPAGKDADALNAGTRGAPQETADAAGGRGEFKRFIEAGHHGG